MQMSPQPQQIILIFQICTGLTVKCNKPASKYGQNESSCTALPNQGFPKLWDSLTIY